MKTLATLLGSVLVPLVTPFREGEEINFDSLAKLVNFVIERKYCDSLVLTGTTGEFYALSDEERIEIWRVAAQAAAGRVPLVAGVGAASTRDAVRLARIAETCGVDVAMVVLPFYSKPSQEGIYRHLRMVAEAITLPVLLYNIPLFTGVNLEPATLARLAEVENIRGVKEEASIHPIQVTGFARATRSDFSIYCGDDPMALQVLSQRGAGVVSGGSQVVGDLTREMIGAHERGDNASASAIYFRLAPFYEALSQNGRINTTPILKKAIEISSGIPIGPPRCPLEPATGEETSVIEAILEVLGRLPGAR